ncbi:hypothetical protein C8R45DRAFT_425979 [Mycena sanguinolenta]|nr:hypothetical protein C8R45DRAFT_425979 [Mycena sanguinolenta]
MSVLCLLVCVSAVLLQCARGPRLREGMKPRVCSVRNPPSRPSSFASRHRVMWVWCCRRSGAGASTLALSSSWGVRVDLVGCSFTNDVPGATSSTPPASWTSASLSLNGITVVPPLSPPLSLPSSTSGSGCSVTATAPASASTISSSSTSSAPSSTSSTAGASRPGTAASVGLGREYSLEFRRDFVVTD